MTDTTGDGIVQIAYLHPEHVSHSWHDSMRRMHDFDRTLPQPRIEPRPLNIRCGSGALIVRNRNFAVTLFLDKTPHEWLLFVDTDMGFEPDAVHRLLEVADPVSAPFVGALCFALMESEYDGLGGHRFTIVPTLYKIGNVIETGHARLCYYGDYPQDTVVQVAATGAAFILVHRSALEALREKHGDKWFDQVVDEDGDVVGEDFSFCVRLGAAGFPMFVHTGVKTNHHKEIWLSEEDYLRQATGASQVQEIHPELPLYIHLPATFAALAAYEHDRAGMLKFTQDLDRYRQVIAATKPEVIVETGTRTGVSALWFARESGAEVITVDVDPDAAARARALGARDGYTIIGLTGSSTDPAIIGAIEERVAGRRCMVSLDSDHSGPHVGREIELYGPLVSPGCYLVVEDTVFGYGESARVLQGLDGMVGSPLDAVSVKLVGDPDWSRDVSIERVHPISSNPAGWWVRNG